MAQNNAINANSVTPLVVSKGGTGANSLTDHGVLLGSGTGAVTPTAVMTNGQLLIGSTGADPVPATVTGGPGVTFVAGAGTLQINVAASLLPWNDVVATPQALLVNNGYSTNNGAVQVVYTLPATAAFGSVIAVSGFSAGGWRINQGAGQSMRLGNTSTTVGAAGHMDSTDAGDCVYMLCVVADTTFVVQAPVGNPDLL